MPVRIQHDQLPNSVYYITFTCYKWKHLFSISHAYNAVYKWFDKLHEKNISVFSYVIMPNHLHVILHFATMPETLNTVIGNAKPVHVNDVLQQF